MQPVLLPLVLGGLLFYALAPAVDRLQKMRVPRAIGAALTLCLVVTSCWAIEHGTIGAPRWGDVWPLAVQRLAVLLDGNCERIAGDSSSSQ